MRPAGHRLSQPGTGFVECPFMNEEVEHEAWFIELPVHEGDGQWIPSGHFRRGEPGEALYSKKREDYNP